MFTTQGARRKGNITWNNNEGGDAIVTLNLSHQNSVYSSLNKVRPDSVECIICVKY